MSADDARLAEITERHANDDGNDGADTEQVILGALRELAAEHDRETTELRRLLRETGEEMRARGRALWPESVGAAPQPMAISPNARAGAHAAFDEATKAGAANTRRCPGGLDGPDFDHNMLCDAVARAIDAGSLAAEALLLSKAEEEKRARAGYARSGHTGKWQDYSAYGAQLVLEEAAKVLAARRSR